MQNVTTIPAHASSFWAASSQPPLDFPRLERDISTEVAIIGAGFTGLSAAHHLRQAGFGTAVVEACDAGWGASGRNGGMAVLRYKKGFGALAKAYGNEVTLGLHKMILDAVDTLESIVSAHGLDCDFSRYGHITAAASSSALRELEADRAWLAQHANDTSPLILQSAAMRERTGTSVYAGGYLDGRAAGIHPMRYSRGLAAALARKGVSIFCGTPVVSVTREGDGYRLQTPAGSVRCQRVIVATNAYTDRMPLDLGLDRRIVPVASSVITTAPIPDAVLAEILPHKHLVTDTRKLTNYFRRLPGNRLLYGGRGDLHGRDKPDSFRGLEKLLVNTFPQLAGSEIEYRWSGKVAVTLDNFPHLGELSPGMFYAMGYGGRGVALAQLLGKLAARLAMGEAVDAGPMSANPFHPVPFHAFRRPAMHVMAGYYQWKDARSA